MLQRREGLELPMCLLKFEVSRGYCCCGWKPQLQGMDIIIATSFTGEEAAKAQVKTPGLELRNSGPNSTFPLTPQLYSLEGHICQQDFTRSIRSLLSS